MSVAGVVTAAAGRLGTPALVAIQDTTAGIVLRLDDDARPAIGSLVEVTGTLADPYGQLEVRTVSDFRITGTGPLPSAWEIDGSSLGESTEGAVVVLAGTVDGRPIKSTSGDLAIVVTTVHGTVRVLADASAGLSPTFVGTGDRVRLTGIAGQRASRKGALDGYRVWLRGPADVVRTAASATPSPTPGPSGTGSPGAATPHKTIAAAILAGSGDVAIEAIVTAPAALLDASHRRIVVQDATAAIEILLPASSSAPAVGRRIRVVGEIGRAYGAPRIKADTVSLVGRGAAPVVELRAAPAAAHEWRLVRIRGDVVEVHRSGDRWTAEVLVAGVRVLVVGLPGAGIPSAAMSEGRSATIVGIVRRPYPSATDRRFAVLPRSSADVLIGGPADDGHVTASAGVSAGTGQPNSSAAPAAAIGATVDLVDLGRHSGEIVRVSGLVASVGDARFRLDDGTAVGMVRLEGEAADVAGSIVVGDALSATGRVTSDPGTGTPFVLVDDPAGIALVGDLDGQDPSASPASSAGAAGPDADPSSGSATALAMGAGPFDPGVPGFGAIGLVLASVASLAVTLLRRRRMRRRLAARIAARLAAIATPPGAAQALQAAELRATSGGGSATA